MPEAPLRTFFPTEESAGSASIIARRIDKNLKNIAAALSYAPTTRSGYTLPSRSRPPATENPKVSTGLSRSSAWITCEYLSSTPVREP